MKGFDVNALKVKGNIVFGIAPYMADNGKQTLDAVVGGITIAPNGEQTVSTKGGLFIHEDVLFVEAKDPKTGKITFPVADALIEIGNAVRRNHGKVVKLRAQRQAEAEAKAAEKERKAAEREQAKQDYIKERVTIAKSQIPLLKALYKGKTMPQRTINEIEKYKSWLEKWEPQSVKDFFPTK